MEIKSSTSLRNGYSEISEYCKSTGQPVYLTKNGEGDLIVMSIEAYEERERIFKIKEQMLLERLNSQNKGYTPEELDTLLRKIVKLD